MKTEDNTKHRAYINEIGDDLESTLQAGLEFIEWHKYINSNTRVFVKPNFTTPFHKEAITTSPTFLECLLKILKSRTRNVILGESDGGNHSFKAEEAFEGHNMYRICEENGVDLVSLSSLPAETIESKILGKTVKVQLPRMLLEDIDCFIAVPVLKVHVMTTVSLSLKNSWGCVPDTMRGMHHQNLSHKLALIARLLKPKIVVVDGINSLNKHGPMYGEAVKTNLVLMGDNSVATDALGVRIMGFSPERVSHIAVAGKAGLGSINLSDVQINTDWQEYRRQFNIEKTLIDRLSTIPFRSDALAQLIFNSPLTVPIYKIASLLRSSEEKALVSRMGKQKGLRPY